MATRWKVEITFLVTKKFQLAINFKNLVIILTLIYGLLLIAFLKHFWCVNNGNWNKWSGILAAIICMGSKSNECEFNLKSKVWFQTKIARHEVQLPLYYIHLKIAQKLDLVSSYILLMQYWADLKLNSSIFWGGKIRVLESFVYGVTCSLAGKRCDLKQNMVQFVNKLYQLEPIRLQRTLVISKRV